MAPTSIFWLVFVFTFVVVIESSRLDSDDGIKT